MAILRQWDNFIPLVTIASPSPLVSDRVNGFIAKGLDLGLKISSILYLGKYEISY